MKKTAWGEKDSDKKRNGWTSAFTLVELLVVISLIGLLSSVVFASVNTARERARVARARADLNEFRKAIALLEDDTGQSPNHHPITACIQNAETFLDVPAAGTVTTDGAFPSWRGPYMSRVPLDPWGGRYIFDPDYFCGNSGTIEIGCEGLAPATVVRVVHSGGPNGSGINLYEADNIVLVLCR